MRTWVVAIVALLLSGCTGGSSDDDPEAHVDDVEVDTGNTTELPVANTPPVVGFGADFANGTAPLAVNFTFTASDADNDTLTWDLATNGTSLASGTVDGNGTFVSESLGFISSAVGGVFSHVFNTTGVHNVTLLVFDGTDNVTASLEINVTAGQAGPTLLAEYTKSGLIGGAYALTGSADTARQCPGFNVNQDGRGCVFLPFSAAGAHDGLPAIVTTNAGNFRMAFYTACATTATGVGFASGSSGGEIAIPAGAGCAIAWSSVIGDWGTERSFTLSVFDFLPEEA